MQKESESMNVKDAAKAWKVSRREVLLYCEEGMVPTAEKNKKGPLVDYYIPRDTEKPPCHRRQAVFMIENINAIKNENANPWVQGYSYDKIIKSYQYFLDCAYISGYVFDAGDNSSRDDKREA